MRVLKEPNVWKLYDDLIAAIPEDAVVAECLAGLSWFLVRSIGTGVAMRPREVTGPVRNAGKIAGMKVRDLAGWVKSWNWYEAAMVRRRAGRVEFTGCVYLSA
jgi:hypothetical protein